MSRGSPCCRYSAVWSRCKCKRSDLRKAIACSCKSGIIKSNWMFFFLDQGVSIDPIDDYGANPAVVALPCWNEPTLLRFAKAGGRLDLVGKKGTDNIIYYAIKYSTVDTIKLITEKDNRGGLQDVNARTRIEGHEFMHCFEHCIYDVNICYCLNTGS